MPITINLPAPLRRFTKGKGKVVVAAATVEAAVAVLLKEHDGLGPYLLDGDGELRPWVIVYVNDHEVRKVLGSRTPLRDGDVVRIVPVIAGGKMGGPADGGLDQQELVRYSRHLLIPEVGLAGQQRLKGAKVLIVGLGGLGTPVAQYLAAAGVGRLGLVEYDRIDLSNLQRQVLYGTADVGQPKAERARDRIRSINPNVAVTLHQERLTSQNALEILKEYDVVVDGTDNFPTRYLVNDACVLLGKPNVYASIYRFEGQLSVFWAEKGPCYRCLYPAPPPPGLVPSCAEGGVLGVLPGIVGSLQASEALKILLGVGEPMVGRLLLFDALDMSFATVKLAKNPSCAACGPQPSITKLLDYEDFCGLTPVTKSDATQILPHDVKRKLDRKEEFLLLDVREPFEFEIAHIPGSTLLPMSELKQREAELDAHKSKEIVVLCHHGARSAQVANYLRRKGFPTVKNLVGGISAWSDDVDPTIPHY